MSPKKLLIIGFDALCWEYMNFLIERDHLPNFQKLRRKSTFGPLKSVYPPGSYIAWPSFMTGVNPGKHSLFYPVVFKDKFDYNGFPFQTSMIKYPTLYEIISNSKKTVGVVNQPGIFPPISVNGFFISKPPSPYSDYTSPKTLREDILSKFPNYGKPLRRDLDPHITIKNAMDMLSLNWEVSKYCFEKDDTDLKSTIFMEVDTVSHWYWDKPELIDQIYGHCDNILGEIIEKYGDSHNMVVLSDHGFGRCLSIFHPNVWLEKIGLLKWKSGASSSSSNFISNNLRKIARGTLKSLGLYDNYMRKSYKNKKIDKVYSELSDSIDWANTKVYFREDMGFRFNILGREKKGIVSLTEANKVFEKLNKEILKLRDPNYFDLQPFKGLIKDEDVFSGPHISKSPDFYIDVNDNYHRGFSCKRNESIFEDNNEQPGKHTMNGIYLIQSENIKESNLENLDLVSLVPNILYLLGIDGRKYFDTEINASMYNKDFLDKTPFKISKEDFEFDREESKLSDSDRESMTKFWKEVGYI